MWLPILFSVIASVILTPFLPIYAQQTLLFVSIFTKSAILFVLPFVIFSLLLKAVIGISKGFILTIFTSICLSNFVSTWLSYFVGKNLYLFSFSSIASHSVAELTPIYSFSIPQLFANDKAMIAAVLVGVISKICLLDEIKKLSSVLNKITNYLLKTVLYMMPIFIMGAIVKLQAEGIFFLIAKEYTVILAVVGLSVFAYILSVYFVSAKFNFKSFIDSLKSMLPATISGFTTMSSAATMPLTIEGASKNSKNPDLVKAIIPVTSNVHLVGDCFAIPIFAFAILKSFGYAEPSIYSYLIFSIYFVWAKFSVAGVPGGGIIVMIPILQEHLGFSSEMSSLITALYILFDPVITCANVLANGAFARILSSFQKKHIQV